MQKKPDHHRVYSVWFHLYETLSKTNVILMSESISVAAWGLLWTNPKATTGHQRCAEPKLLDFYFFSGLFSPHLHFCVIQWVPTIDPWTSVPWTEKKGDRWKVFQGAAFIQVCLEQKKKETGGRFFKVLHSFNCKWLFIIVKLSPCNLVLKYSFIICHGDSQWWSWIFNCPYLTK